VLPRDAQDDGGTTERIEAFLEGPTRPIPRHRPLHLRSQPLRRPRQRVPLDTRADWEQALRHEDHRFARYGRPVAVLVVEVRTTDADGADRVARRLGDIVRELARASDRIARVSQTRFHVLLPETDEAAALHFGTRIRRAVRTEVAERSPDARWDVAAAAAAPHHGATLADALRVAQARLID
jgi:GGDEF domain-containing protein